MISTEATKSQGRLTLRDIKIQAIKDALRDCNNNRTYAARQLQVSLRWLRIWISKYKIRHDDNQLGESARGKTLC